MLFTALGTIFTAWKKKGPANEVEIKEPEQLFGANVPNIQGKLAAIMLTRKAEQRESVLGPFRQDSSVSKGHTRVIEKKDLQKFFNIVLSSNKLLNLLPMIMFARTEETPDQEIRYGATMCMYIEGELQDILVILQQEKAKDPGVEQTALYQYVVKAIAQSKKEYTIILPVVLMQDLLDSPRLEEELEAFLRLNFDCQFAYEYHSHKTSADGKTIVPASERWEALFAEWSEAKDTRANVKKLMVGMVKFMPPLKIENVSETYQFLALTQALHEVLHSVVVNFTKEEEEEWSEILGKMGAASRKDIARVEWKNRAKASTGSMRYRKEHGIPQPTEMTQSMTVKAYETEMYCDLFTVYLMEQADIPDAYTQLFGTKLSDPRMQAFFEKHLARLQALDAQGLIQLFSQAHLDESDMDKIRGFFAAANLVVENHPELRRLLELSPLGALAEMVMPASGVLH